MIKIELYDRLFSGLVTECGGVEAAAAIISAFKGQPYHKANISKICHGEMHAPAFAIAALEDAAKHYPITTLMYERIEKPGDSAQNLPALLAIWAKEHGEGLSSVLDAISENSDGGSNLTPFEAQKSLKELLENRDALNAVIDAVKAVAS